MERMKHMDKSAWFSKLASGFWEGFEKQAFACKEAGIFGNIRRTAKSVLTKIPPITAAGKADRVAADIAHAKSLKSMARDTARVNAERAARPAREAAHREAEQQAEHAYQTKQKAWKASSDAKFQADRGYREPYEITHHRNPMDHG